MQEPPKSDDERSLAGMGAISLLMGACMALVIGGVFLAARFASRLTAEAPLSTLLNTPSPTPRPAPTATLSPPPSSPIPPTTAPTATTDFQEVWAQSETYLTTNYGSEKVLDLILPILDQLQQPDDLAHAYYYLGRAESQLGHFQIAAAYYEKLYAYQPTAENLFLLAMAYDLGGDLDHALEKYMLLLEWEDAEGDAYREPANARIQAIIEVIGTPTPEP